MTTKQALEIPEQLGLKVSIEPCAQGYFFRTMYKGVSISVQKKTMIKGHRALAKGLIVYINRQVELYMKDFETIEEILAT